jgi:hypothetical protein
MLVILSSLLWELHALKQADEPVITAERVPRPIHRGESQQHVPSLESFLQPGESFLALTQPLMHYGQVIRRHVTPSRLTS